MKHIDKLSDSLISQGWYIWDNFLDLQQIQAIKGCIPEMLQNARIGYQNTLQHNNDIRSDQTIWLERNMGAPVDHYLDRMNDIRKELNHRLFLGLRDLETHFCRYPRGGFYKKHLDNFRGQERRRVTSVLYLNESWHQGEGGELVMYDLQGNKLFTVEPLAGRMVFFISEDFPHEVLPTQQKRESIAGWFLTEKIL